MSQVLRDNLFVIPISDGMNIVYAPLHGAAFYASDKAASLCSGYSCGKDIQETKENATLVKYLKFLNGKNVQEPQLKPFASSANLVIILSQMCNLACSYCYAQDARSKDVLAKEKLKVAIDSHFDRISNKLHFSFIGGGEPTLTWELLFWAINYIRSIDAGTRNVSIGVTTNGTLLNDERINFLKENNVRIGLSFEILPDVQSTQRCFSDNKNSFEIINVVIKKMETNGIHFSFRSTITSINVTRMSEMVEFVIRNYPKIKSLHFEQVTSTEIKKDFYDKFIYHFIKARKLGECNGIEVYCSGSNCLNSIKSRFCGGEFCLTPTGDIVACHRISSPDERAFDLFNYARVGERGILINKTKLDRIEKFFNIKRASCSTCFAKWHCAGSCSMEKTIYSEEMRDLKCYFVKALIKNLLIDKLESHN